VTIAQTLQHSNTMANTSVHKPNYRQTKHKPICIYTYRQKALKLLKIKKGPIDKTLQCSAVITT